ncbi:MAG TPA: VWA domain-containing protein [Clostridiales bacterium]|nr:VWA domain-containing protein [Clostridiales bacterium]
MKKISKRLIIIVVIIVMTLNLVSCSASENATDSMMNANATKSDSSMLQEYEGFEVEHNTEEYNSITENAYKSVADYPLSTFSIDVDTASYSNVRRLINDGQIVDTGAVRIEEMINHFKYDYPTPKENKPFSVTTELSECPWNKDAKLMLIGLKTKDIDFSESPNSNLVFLLDVSGSMQDYDKLPLVQKAFKMLTSELTEKDKISIVTYASNDRIVIEGINGNDSETINEALDSLEAGGSTHGSKGIETAYELAEKYFIKNGNNRVILATDGDLNVGLTSENELEKLITEKKESGVFLSVLGFGAGNIKDNKMEVLADKGNGNYSYIDSIYEAKKVLVDEMGATLVTVAKDVKLQVEFNPANVKGYRLIGYENRLLSSEDFNDDKKDAGEIGAGHSVTALYEIIMNDSKMEIPSTALKYQSNENTNKDNVDELLTVNIRYKKPDSNTSDLMTMVVNKNDYKEELLNNLKFAAAVAEFGMILRDSNYIGDANFNNVLELLDKEVVNDDKYKLEFIELVNKAAKIYNVNIIETFSEDKIISDEAILKIFNEAEIAYSWFTGYGEIGLNNKSIKIDKNKYVEVKHDNIVTKNDLKDYISIYFDEKTVDELINTKIDEKYNLFIDFEGKLDCFGVYVAQINYADAKKEFKIIKNNDNKNTITVDIKCKVIMASPEKSISYNYVYEKLDNNKWVFTNYQLPAKYCIDNGS